MRVRITSLSVAILAVPVFALAQGMTPTATDPPMKGKVMSDFEFLSVLVALLSAVIAFISLYRTREVAKRQVELQERQVALEGESAKLAKLQRDQIEAAMESPSLTVTIFAYSKGDLHDTAVKLLFENNSALNRSINDCSVGLLDNPADGFPSGARRAEFEDKPAIYPIAIPPHSSLALFSFAGLLKPVYEYRYGANTTDEKSVAVVVDVAGKSTPLVRVIGRYSPSDGLRSS